MYTYIISVNALYIRDFQIVWTGRGLIRAEVSRYILCMHCACVTMSELPTCHCSKKVLLSLKNHILRWKKVFLRAKRASRAQSPFGRGPGPWNTGFRCFLVTILALFLNIIIQKLWPSFHNINNVCKFQNFHSPVLKKKKKKKKTSQFLKTYFLQAKTYCRIFL